MVDEELKFKEAETLIAIADTYHDFSKGVRANGHVVGDGIFEKYLEELRQKNNLDFQGSIKKERDIIDCVESRFPELKNERTIILTEISKSEYKLTERGEDFNFDANVVFMYDCGADFNKILEIHERSFNPNKKRNEIYHHSIAQDYDKANKAAEWNPVYLVATEDKPINCLYGNNEINGLEIKIHGNCSKPSHDTCAISDNYLTFKTIPETIPETTKSITIKRHELKKYDFSVNSLTNFLNEDGLKKKGKLINKMLRWITCIGTDADLDNLSEILNGPITKIKKKVYDIKRSLDFSQIAAVMTLQNKDVNYVLVTCDLLCHLNAKLHGISSIYLHDKVLRYYSALSPAVVLENKIAKIRHILDKIKQCQDIKITDGQANSQTNRQANVDSQTNEQEYNLGDLVRNIDRLKDFITITITHNKYIIVDQIKSINNIYDEKIKNICGKTLILVDAPTDIISPTDIIKTIEKLEPEEYKLKIVDTILHDLNTNYEKLKYNLELSSAIKQVFENNETIAIKEKTIKINNIVIDYRDISIPNSIIRLFEENLSINIGQFNNYVEKLFKGDSGNSYSFYFECVAKAKGLAGNQNGIFDKFSNLFHEVMIKTFAENKFYRSSGRREELVKKGFEKILKMYSDNIGKFITKHSKNIQRMGGGHDTYSESDKETGHDTGHDTYSESTKTIEYNNPQSTDISKQSDTAQSIDSKRSAVTTIGDIESPAAKRICIQPIPGQADTKSEFLGCNPDVFIDDKNIESINDLFDVYEDIVNMNGYDYIRMSFSMNIFFKDQEEDMKYMQTNTSATIDNNRQYIQYIQKLASLSIDNATILNSAINLLEEELGKIRVKQEEPDRELKQELEEELNKIKQGKLDRELEQELDKIRVIQGNLEQELEQDIDALWDILYKLKSRLQYYEKGEYYYYVYTYIFDNPAVSNFMRYYDYIKIQEYRVKDIIKIQEIYNSIYEQIEAIEGTGETNPMQKGGRLFFCNLNKDCYHKYNRYYDSTETRMKLLMRLLKKRYKL